MIIHKKIFFEIHNNLSQEEPGSDESTLRALILIPDLNDQSTILDIGCGPGRQTLAMARKVR